MLHWSCQDSWTPSPNIYIHSYMWNNLDLHHRQDVPRPTDFREYRSSMMTILNDDLKQILIASCYQTAGRYLISWFPSLLWILLSSAERAKFGQELPFYTEIYFVILCIAPRSRFQADIWNPSFASDGRQAGRSYGRTYKMTTIPVSADELG